MYAAAPTADAVIGPVETQAGELALAPRVKRGVTPPEQYPSSYSYTPDGDFILDRHPEHPQVLIVSACSGHGFKFAPAIGEICSDLMVEGWTKWDLTKFRSGRWKVASA